MRNHFTIRLVVFCLMMMMITASAKASQQQNLEESILGQRIKLHLNKVTLMNALSTLSVIHRVPIGIEYSLADQNEPKLLLDTENSSLKDILDSIVKQEPLYQWELVDGVINFVPARERDPFLEGLLKTSVSSFDPGQWTIKFQLRDAIGDTPEVKSLLEWHSVTLAKYGDYAYFPSIYTKKGVDLRMSNTTVRRILNSVVKFTEHKHWAIGWRKEEKKVLSIWL